MPGGDGDRPTSRASRSVPVSALCGALGCGLIIGGVALAVYSRFWASTWPLDTVIGQDLFGSFTGLDVSSVPARYATTAAIIGILMSVSVVVVTAMGTSAGPRHQLMRRLARVVWAGGLLILPWMAIAGHLPGVWRQVRVQFPLFEQLPTALAAAALVVGGTALTSGLLWRRPRNETSSRLLPVVALVAGVIVAAAVAVPANGAGDDRHHVDRTTAPASAAPAMPQRLGAQRYELTVPLVGEQPDVVVAGAGFVAASPRGITAYDGGTGAERWHHLRTDNVDPGSHTYLRYESGSLHSLDGGSVVLARWNRLGWTAFDAVTGETLWNESEFTRDDSRGTFWDLGERGSFRPTPGPLVLSNKDHIVRYDARTGKRSWTVDTAGIDCADASASLAITDDAIYRMAGCERGGEPVAMVAVLDSGTGAIIAREELPVSQGARVGFDSQLERISNSVVVRWRLAGNTAWRLVNAPPDLTTVPFVIDPHAPTPVAVDTAGTQVLTVDYRTPGSDEYVVRDVHTGAPRYEVAPAYSAFAPRRLPYPGEQFLAEEMVQIVMPESATDVPQIESWSRADGHATTRHAIDFGRNGRVQGMLVVPGAVLVMSSGGGGARIVAYG
ncbi:PQQ-binding-like beta-propeller repeat protein [Nocardia sp. NPDC052254]|uniref:outer membrane protein assembly factor BamB family protein n=1 Tax=Nocardia sp. NPDC052254 TaxID=3155681 RepID=UPI00342FAE32